MVQI
jgi:uncharacterized membrane protein YphA (DoxX/SURF4 family)